GEVDGVRTPERSHPRSMVPRAAVCCVGAGHHAHAAIAESGGVFMAIQKVGIVGFGQMGSGIAQVCAMAGFDVLAREIDQKFIDNGLKRVDGSLARVVKSGKMTEADAKAARDRIHGTTSLAAFADRDLVIEAVIEVM